MRVFRVFDVMIGALMVLVHVHLFSLARTRFKSFVTSFDRVQCWQRPNPVVTRDSFAATGIHIKVTKPNDQFQQPLHLNFQSVVAVWVIMAGIQVHDTTSPEKVSRMFFLFNQ